MEPSSVWEVPAGRSVWIILGIAWVISGGRFEAGRQSAAARLPRGRHQTETSLSKCNAVHLKVWMKLWLRHFLNQTFPAVLSMSCLQLFFKGCQVCNLNLCVPHMCFCTFWIEWCRNQLNAIVPSAVLICVYFLIFLRKEPIHIQKWAPDILKTSCWSLLSPEEIAVSQNYDPQGLLTHAQIATGTTDCTTETHAPRVVCPCRNPGFRAPQQPDTAKAISTVTS